MVRVSARLGGDPVTEYPARRIPTVSLAMRRRLARLGRSEIVEKKLQEFFAREHESKLVFAFAIARLGPASGARRRALDSIPFDEFLVSRQHIIPGAAGIRAPEARLADTALGDRDLGAAVDVGDIPLGCFVGNRALDQRLSAAEKPLSVGEAFSSSVEASVNDIHDTLLLTDRPSIRLLHSHVPFDQSADLALGVSSREHPLHELSMLLLGFGIFLGSETDDRQQFLNLGEHATLDDLANLLVAGP